METFLGGRVALYGGDSREVLREFADNTFDSVVCDPPYSLVSIVKRFGKSKPENEKFAMNNPTNAYKRASAGFMGCTWDTGEVAFDPAFWAEVLRVLKPGGHLVAFSGTRTYHRLASAIEDAGFEVRDMISWNFGTGFPKSHNISKKLDDEKERCSCSENLRDLQQDLDSADTLSSGAQQNMRADMFGDQYQPEAFGTNEGCSIDTMPDVPEARASSAFTDKEAAGGLLQQLMPEQDICGSMPIDLGERTSGICGNAAGGSSAGNGAFKGRDQSGLEGRRDISETPRKLRERQIRSLPTQSDDDGKEGRLRDGTSANHGATHRPIIDADGMRSSSGSQAAEQCDNQSRIMAGQSLAQNGRTWSDCGWCGKPLVPDGLGTALKPALEPIVLARKPLSEKTVAANVLRWGTGAINVDGCRVGEKIEYRPGGLHRGSGSTVGSFTGEQRHTEAQGRWPANVLHDGSDEVLELFPTLGKSTGGRRGDANVFGGMKGQERGFTLGDPGYGDSGSAARFFYSAKADSDSRAGSKHPTVKPVDLMQWLIRLVTPKGGCVLDPFAGSGSTAEAAFREGCICTLIEREAPYRADIARRMVLVMAGPDERSREIVKAKGLEFDAGPLFEGIE